MKQLSLPVCLSALIGLVAVGGEARGENHPPFAGAATTFYEYHVNPNGETSCTSGGATCIESVSTRLDAGYDGALVFISDFNVSDDDKNAFFVDDLHISVANQDYNPTTGDVSFDAVVTFDGGTVRNITWTMKVGILLYETPDVHVSDEYLMSCNAALNASCTDTGSEPTTDLMGSGHQFLTFVPVSLQWESRSGAQIKPTELSFDISSLLTANGTDSDWTTECALKGTSVSGGSARCRQTIIGVSAASTALAVNQLNLPGSQGGYGDGVWMARYLRQAASAPTQIFVAWTRGELTFGSAAELASIGGGCSAPRTEIGSSEIALLQSVYETPPNCGTAGHKPCANRYVVYDFDQTTGLQCAAPACSSWSGHTQRFVAGTGAAMAVTGDTDCRIVEIR